MITKELKKKILLALNIVYLQKC